MNANTYETTNNKQTNEQNNEFNLFELIQQTEPETENLNDFYRLPAEQITEEQIRNLRELTGEELTTEQIKIMRIYLNEELILIYIGELKIKSDEYNEETFLTNYQKHFKQIQTIRNLSNLTESNEQNEINEQLTEEQILRIGTRTKEQILRIRNLNKSNETNEHNEHNEKSNKIECLEIITPEEMNILKQVEQIEINDNFEFFTVETLGKLQTITPAKRLRIIDKLRISAQRRNLRRFQQIKKYIKIYNTLNNVDKFESFINKQQKRAEGIQTNINKLISLLNNVNECKEIEDIKNSLLNDIPILINNLINLRDKIKKYKINVCLSKFNEYVYLSEFYLSLKLNNRFNLKTVYDIYENRIVLNYFYNMKHEIFNIIDNEKDFAQLQINKYYNEIYEEFEIYANKIETVRNEEFKKIKQTFKTGLDTIEEHKQNFINIEQEIFNLNHLRDETILKAYKFNEYKIINRIRRTLNKDFDRDFKDYTPEAKAEALKKVRDLNKMYLYKNKK